jgi:hypothetical protein
MAPDIISGTSNRRSREEAILGGRLWGSFMIVTGFQGRHVLPDRLMDPLDLLKGLEPVLGELIVDFPAAPPLG